LAGCISFLAGGVRSLPQLWGAGSSVNWHAFLYSEVAAPEDGRTPPPANPSVAEGIPASPETNLNLESFALFFDYKQPERTR